MNHSSDNVSTYSIDHLFRFNSDSLKIVWQQSEHVIWNQHYLTVVILLRLYAILILLSTNKRWLSPLHDSTWTKSLQKPPNVRVGISGLSIIWKHSGISYSSVNTWRSSHTLIWAFLLTLNENPPEIEEKFIYSSC